jgi:hypothetical protein
MMHVTVYVAAGVAGLLIDLKLLAPPLRKFRALVAILMMMHADLCVFCC